MRAETVAALESIGFEKSWCGSPDCQMLRKMVVCPKSKLHLVIEVAKEEHGRLEVRVSLASEEGWMVLLSYAVADEVEGLDVEALVEDSMKRVSEKLVEVAQAAAQVAMTGM
jgi:hypothetical protein